jgi:hypothetical protein
VLVLHQNLMDVVRMCRAAGEVVSQDLKDVTKASGIVNINVGHALVALHKKSQLQVSKMI